MIIPPRAVIIAFGLLVMVLTGLRLTRAGSPYPVLMLTLHKLLSLGVLVLLIHTAMQVHRIAPLSRSEMIAPAVTTILFLGLVATGGLLSGRAQPSRALKVGHHVAGYLGVIATSGALYLLLAGI